MTGLETAGTRPVTQASLVERARHFRRRGATGGGPIALCALMARDPVER